jgi:hypothetical protein
VTGSRIHGILSAIHGLLSEYKQAELEEAAKYPGVSRTMRAVLNALAGELSETFPSENTRGGVPSAHNLKKRSHSSTNAVPAEILNALRSSPYFESTGSIVEFAKSVGIKLQRAPKESKERLAKKLARAMTMLPEGRRSQIMRELSTNSSGQTQGWIDVIKTR